MNNFFKDLEAKLNNSSLTYSIETSENEKLNRMMKVKIPCGRENQLITFYEKDDEYNRIIDSSFESYRFLHGYQAVWSENHKMIECEVEQTLDFLPINFPLKGIDSLINGDGVESEQDEEKPTQVTHVDLIEHGDIKISIGALSNDFTTIFRAKERRFFPFHKLKSRFVSLKIEGVSVHNHDEA